MTPAVRMYVTAPITACTARVQEWTGALTDDILTPRPLCPQATIGTQTDETTQPRIETLLESEAPAIPKETTMLGADSAQEH